MDGFTLHLGEKLLYFWDHNILLSIIQNKRIETSRVKLIAFKSFTFLHRFVHCLVQNSEQ